MPNYELTLIDVIEELSAQKDIYHRPMRIAQDIMNADVKTLTLDHTVSQCQQFMENHRVRHATVIDLPNDKEQKAYFIGVVSERDILRVNSPVTKKADKVEADKRALRQLVAQIVARKPKSVSPHTPIEDLITMMISHHIDLLPVIRHEDVVGMITTTDLLSIFLEIKKTVFALFPEFKENALHPENNPENSTKSDFLLSWIGQTAQDIMSKELVYLGPRENLAKAIEVMQGAEIRHLPVIDDRGDLVGLVSDRNILQNLPYIARRPPSPPKKFREHLFLTNISDKCLELPLEKIMKRKVFHVSPGSSIFEAVETLLSNRISCLPIVDEKDNPLGIITITDLMRTLLAVYEPISKTTTSQTNHKDLSPDSAYKM